MMMRTGDVSNSKAKDIFEPRPSVNFDANSHLSANLRDT